MSTDTKPMNKKEILEYVKGLPSASFKNEYGEKFTIHSNGVMVMMSGDEVDAMVRGKYKPDGKHIDLFSPGFDIWSVDELDKLGAALQQVAKELRNGK